MDDRLLGLAKKAGLLEIGEASVGQAARGGKAVLIISAADASDGSKRRARGYADRSGTAHIVVPSTKLELSAMVGRGAPGTLALTDAGIAAKYVSMLARSDPEQYAGTAALLTAKAERIQARRAQALRQKKSNRTGKRRTTQ